MHVHLRWIVNRLSMTRQLRLAVVVGLIGLCASELKARGRPTYYTPSDKILILGAVPQEITVFVSAMKDPAKKELWGIPYWQGEIEGKPVIVAITGIGKVYTAMTTTLFLTELKPRVVLMSGTGARINQQLRTGDVIVAGTLYEHDYGSLTRNDMVYRPFNSPANGGEVENKFAPPNTLLELADRAMATYRSPQVTANGATYEVKVRRGVVASADLFGMTQQRIDNLRTHFHTDIVEMESAPLGRVCQTFGVPYLVVRAGSNEAQEAPNDDYLRLSPIAARQAAYFSLYRLKYL
jgi:5'-methylthioadenosine/S-adenosylhomocysteine nucleosidase